MNVPPSESENIMWPSAPTTTAGVRSPRRNFRMYQLHAFHRSRQRERAHEQHHQQHAEQWAR